MPGPCPWHARHRHWALSRSYHCCYGRLLWLLWRSARPQTSATRVLPGRAGAGMERAEKKVGDLAEVNWGEGCMQTTDLSLSAVMDCRQSARSDPAPVPLNVAWRGSEQGCDCACALCSGLRRRQQTSQGLRGSRYLDDASASAAPFLPSPLDCVQAGFSAATQCTCKDDNSVRSFLH